MLLVAIFHSGYAYLKNFSYFFHFFFNILKHLRVFIILFDFSNINTVFKLQDIGSIRLKKTFKFIATHRLAWRIVSINEVSTGQNRTGESRLGAVNHTNRSFANECFSIFLGKNQFDVPIISPFIFFMQRSVAYSV